MGKAEAEEAWTKQKIPGSLFLPPTANITQPGNECPGPEGRRQSGPLHAPRSIVCEVTGEMIGHILLLQLRRRHPALQYWTSLPAKRFRCLFSLRAYSSSMYSSRSGLHQQHGIQFHFTGGVKSGRGVAASKKAIAEAARSV